jgi:four helix bundle protein
MSCVESAIWNLELAIAYRYIGHRGIGNHRVIGGSGHRVIGGLGDWGLASLALGSRNLRCFGVKGLRLLHAATVLGLDWPDVVGINTGPACARESGMTPEELRARLAVFAKAVEGLSRPLLAGIETRDPALQLRRASSSAAANHRAAGRGRSHAEFTSKLGVALEEADEALFWLEHLNDCQLAPADQLTPLLKEGRELVAILTTSTHTARARTHRPSRFTR